MPCQEHFSKFTSARDISQNPCVCVTASDTRFLPTQKTAISSAYAITYTSEAFNEKPRTCILFIMLLHKTALNKWPTAGTRDILPHRMFSNKELLIISLVEQPLYGIRTPSKITIPTPSYESTLNKKTMLNLIERFGQVDL